MKRNLVWMFSVITVVSLLLGSISCQSTSPAPAPAPTPAPSPSPAPAPAPINLKLSSHLPPGHIITISMKEGFADIEKMSGGRLTATLYDSGSLASGTEALDAVMGGVADIAQANWMYNPGVFPLTYAFTFSGMFPDAATATRVQWDVWNNTNYLQAEYSKFVPISFYSGGPYVMMLKKKITTVDGLKGLKLRSQGGAETPELEALGASVVQMPSGDVYNSLERSLVDGAPYPWASIPAYKYYEVVKYVIDNIAMGGAFMGLAMNKGTWNKLSPELQAIVSKCGQDTSVRVANYFQAETGLARSFSAAKGVEVYDLSPAELAKFSSIVSGVADKWVKETDAKGLPGTQVMEALRSAAKKYTSRW